MDNNSNDFDSKFSSDILVIGVNITDWFYTSRYIKAYLDFLNYIKLSLNFQARKLYTNIMVTLSGMNMKKTYLKIQI